MKKTTIFTAVILVLFLLSSITNQNNNVLTGFHNSKRQNNDTTYIEWSKTRKLAWDDFRGVPDVGVTGAATNSITKVKIERVYKDSILLNISTIFICQYSWCIKSDRSTLLLNHEQKHFDSQEIFSRKIRKVFYSYNFSSSIEYNSFLNQTINKYYSLSNSFDDLYDKETKHGTDLEAQKRWDIKIDSMLNVLEAYSSPYVVVRKTYK